MICLIIMVDVVNERRVRQRLRCFLCTRHNCGYLGHGILSTPLNLATLLWTYSSTRSCNLQTSCLLWDSHHSDKTKKAPKNHFTPTHTHNIPPPSHHILVIGLIPEYSVKKVLLFKVFSKHTLAALNKTATKAYPHPLVYFLSFFLSQ